MKQVPLITGVICGIAVTFAVLTYMFPEIPRRLAADGKNKNKNKIKKGDMC